MSYLQEFRVQIAKGDLRQLLQLWEEYCSGDTIEGKELCGILEAVNQSDVAQQFGQYVELALPLWQEMRDPAESFDVLKLILDLQTTNSPQLAETCHKVLESNYGTQERFGVKIRLVGLRARDNFRGAIRNYELLSHLNKGKFIFHAGGWGTGEIMDYSLVREELTAEFENVVGRKQISFDNAFKYLKPLDDDHFLSRRFGDPDDLEAEARKHPVKVISLLLRDLGPKTAAEIKEEMFDLVIPGAEWTKWWQTTRSRLKKDTRVEMPANIREPFRLHDTEISHGERFQQQIAHANTPKGVIQAIYNFVRDFSETLKNDDTKTFLKNQLQELATTEDLSVPHKLQVAFLQENIMLPSDESLSADEIVKELEDVVSTIDGVEIVAFKKRVLMTVRGQRSDWVNLFMELFFHLPQSSLKEYILKQLNHKETLPQLEEALQELIAHPTRHPNCYVWFFQQIMENSDLPFGDKSGQCKFFEGLLILFSVLEKDTANRDLIKKMYTIMSKKRWEVVRNILEDSTVDFAREFLLLVSKCQTLTDHDIKILHSLAEVAHPILNTKSDAAEMDDTIWTTEQGFQKIQEKMHQIGTVETVDNAREIEEARALGDLRENSEYKFALERRSRLQAELKMFSEQMKKARILTTEDISTDSIGIGVQAQLESKDGETMTYVLLGPWDADPDHNILSFQSKLAMTMAGHKVGETFDFQGTPYTVKSIKSYLES